MVIPAAIAEQEPLSEIDVDLKEFEQRAEADPASLETLDFLAIEYYKRGYLRRTHHIAEILTRLTPDRIKVWRLLANVQIALKLMTRAKHTLEHILEMPGVEQKLVDWAQSKLREIPSFAQANTQQAAPASPAAGPATSAPTTPNRQNQRQEMPGLFDMVAPSKPRNSKSAGLSGALERQAIVTNIASKSSEQLEGIKAQLALDPDNPDLLDWYAFALYSCDQTDESIKIYEKYLNLHPPRDNVLYYLGSAYLKIPDVKKAFRCFSELKKRFPNSKLIEKVNDKQARLRALLKG